MEQKISCLSAAVGTTLNFIDKDSVLQPDLNHYDKSSESRIKIKRARAVLFSS